MRTMTSTSSDLMSEAFRSQTQSNEKEKLEKESINEETILYRIKDDAGSELDKFKCCKVNEVKNKY